jgi:hypothetical protein
MTLKQFVIINLKANQEDKYLNAIIELIGKDVNFPETENIQQMANYLYTDLDQKNTQAFQKLLMFWKFVENNNQQPTDMNLLNEINHIIDLQTNDENYKYAHQIPSHINNRK